MENKYLSFLPVIAGIFLMLAVSGCATKTDTQVINRSFNPPPAMFQCDDSSQRPVGEVIMESEVARYVTSLEYVQKDCKLRLKDMQILVKCFNDPNCNPDNLAEYIGLVREERKQ